MLYIRNSNELKRISAFLILVSERKQMLIELLDLLEKVCPGKGEDDDLRSVGVSFLDCHNFLLAVKIPSELDEESDQQSWAAVAKYAEDHGIWIEKEDYNKDEAHYSLLPEVVAMKNNQGKTDLKHSSD